MSGAKRPALKDWQHDLVASALHADAVAAARLLPWLANGPVPATAALRIHAEAVHQGLQTALAQRVPTVKALVGDDFFGELVRGFARTHPPRQPQLALWGEALPAFIRLHPGCQALPYLADAAAFDLALDTAALAPPGVWMPSMELAPGLHFQALQSLQVMSADYAVDQLRDAVTAANAGSATALESLRMECGNYHYALWCGANGEIRCRAVGAGVAALLVGLLGAGAIDEANRDHELPPQDAAQEDVVEAALCAALTATATPENDASALLTALLRELAGLGGVKLTSAATAI